VKGERWRGETRLRRDCSESAQCSIFFAPLLLCDPFAAWNGAVGLPLALAGVSSVTTADAAEIRKKAQR
jgi:hypothetical protein